MGPIPRPGDTFGSFVIEDILGRGSMGVVLRARHVALRRTVALKLLSPELVGSDEFVARFKREAAALGRLESPYVVRAYDAGECDGWLYIATQYVPGGDLATLIARRGPLSPASALGLLDQILAGLSDAHAAGLLHRDVKPANILVQDSPGGLQAYLCDLGISQFTETDTQVTNSPVGTPAYMAPERFMGMPASISSDIYSVGCVLWCLVSGKQPYEGTHLSVIRQHEQAPLPQLPMAQVESEPWVRTVNAVLNRSLSKQSEHRFASATEMREAIVGGSASAAVTIVGTATQQWGAASQQQTLAPAWESQVTPPGLSSPRRWRKGLVASAALVALIVAVVSGVVIGTRSASDGPAATTDPASAAFASLPATATTTKAPAPAAPLEVAPPSDPATPSPRTDTVPESLVRCWDTSSAPRFGSCPPLQGPGAMEFVFVDLARSANCYEVASRGLQRGVVRQWECRAPSSGTGPATVYLREWAIVTDAQNYYAGRFGDAQMVTDGAGVPVFDRWVNASGGEASQLFVLAPFSLSISAPGSADPLRDLLDFIAAEIRMAPAFKFPNYGA